MNRLNWAEGTWVDDGMASSSGGFPVYQREYQKGRSSALLPPHLKSKDFQTASLPGQDTLLINVAPSQRSFNQMSRESSATVCTAPGPSRGRNGTTSLPSLFDNIRIPSFRQNARDGYDLRRPVMTTANQESTHQNVIDLTEEPSSPPDPTPRPERRSPRHRQSRSSDPEVVDLSDTSSSTTERPSSPEIQFISSRARSRSSSARNRQADAGNTPFRHRQAPHLPNGSLLPSIFQLGFGHNLGHNLAHFRTQIGQVRDQLVNIDFGGTGHLNVPEALDVSAVGFDLDEPQHRPHATPLPTYEPPAAPRTGFTRHTTSNESVVCPNC